LDPSPSSVRHPANIAGYVSVAECSDSSPSGKPPAHGAVRPFCTGVMLWYARVGMILRLRIRTEDERGVPSVGCKKGKSKTKPKPGRFVCEDCGAVVKAKKDACEPKKIRAAKK
jgi:hypothetical protein